MSSKPRIYITRRIPLTGLEKLKAKTYELVHRDIRDDAVSDDELKRNIKGCDALLCLLSDNIDDSVLKAAGPTLKTICTMSSGYCHIDIEACERNNIQVANTPGVSSEAVAEMTVGLLMAVARRIPEGIDAVKNGEWGTWKPLWLCGMGLKGSTVGICGLGRIGFEVVKRLKPNCINKFMYCGSYANPSAAELPAEKVSFDTLIQQSDFIIVCCALTDETREMFHSEVFKKMKNDAILVNISRGQVVNHDDLYEALKTGEIKGAGLDVTFPEPFPPDHPLLKQKNCIITPHMASAVTVVRELMSDVAATNIIAGIEGMALPNLVTDLQPMNDL